METMTQATVLIFDDKNIFVQQISMLEGFLKDHVTISQYYCF